MVSDGPGTDKLLCPLQARPSRHRCDPNPDCRRDEFWEIIHYQHITERVPAGHDPCCVQRGYNDVCHQRGMVSLYNGIISSPTIIYWLISGLLPTINYIKVNCNMASPYKSHTTIYSEWMFS